VIPPHLQEAYKQHYRAFREEHRPKGPTEQYLVDSLADLSWSVGNVRCQITSRIHLAGSRPLVNPHESHTPETEQAMAQAFNVGDIGPSMNTLGIYEQRKMRLFNTTLKQLAELQEKRKAREKEELELAAALRKDDLANRQPEEPAWHPTQNGFVCSLV
jgi:hypothetical protein